MMDTVLTRFDALIPSARVVVINDTRREDVFDESRLDRNMQRVRRVDHGM